VRRHPSSPGQAWRIASSLIRRRLGKGLDVVVPYDGGRSRIVADLRTALGLALYRYGHRAPEIELMRRLLRPGDAFVDGGANVGLFALVAAGCVGASGRVVCFEPASATRSALRRNVDLNAFDWVDVRAEALGGSASRGLLLSFEGDGAGLSSFAPATAEGARREDVPIATLDSVLAVLPDIRLVKLDLEGAELKALRGAGELLERGPHLIVEIEPGHLARQDASVGELVAFLTERRYRLYEITPAGDSYQLDPLGDRLPSGTNVFATRKDRPDAPIFGAS
jgi:FkbM family methyltransferase